MLNRQLSSSSNKKTRKKQSYRTPLECLNGIAGSDSSIRLSSASSSSISIDAPRGCLRFFLSNSSASKNPLYRPKSLSQTTPKSATRVKSSKPSSCSSSRSIKTLKENLPKPISQKEKSKINPPRLYQWQSGKKPNSKAAPKPKLCTNLGSSDGLVGNSASLSAHLSRKLSNLKQNLNAVKMVDESGEPPQLVKFPNLRNSGVENCTPVGKLASGHCLGVEFDDDSVKEDSSSTPNAAATTPPVQPSVSPEIQCGSSMLVSAATPACYGAGHIVSGVPDRRKCRAKGILTVEGTDFNCAKANIFHNSDEVDNDHHKSRVSLVPQPVEASMLWLLSPCGEEAEVQNSDLTNGLRCLRKSVGSDTLLSDSSASSDHKFSFDLGDNFENSSTISKGSRRRTRITLLSPKGNPAFQGLSRVSSGEVAACSSAISPHAAHTWEAVISPKQRKHRYDLLGENSPFSANSLGSGNVIQTPQSDLSSDSHVGLSWLKNHDQDPLEEVLLRASLTPKTRMSIWDPPGLSFQFSDLMSSTNSIDLAQFPTAWDYSASCTSYCTSEDMSASQMRISWRDGLVSRIFEMDEFDCCRCLSDDENDAKECSSNGKLKSSPSHEFKVDVGKVETFGSPEVVGHDLKSDSDGEANKKFPQQRSNSCAESLSIDGGGLVASGDSDWTSCYKNKLFEL